MKKIVFLLEVVLILAISFTSLDIKAKDINLKDIEQHWAKTNILKLIGKDIINGYPDDTFKPENEIRVDEFIKLTVTALGYTDIQNSTKYWAENYISKAHELKLIHQGEIKHYDIPILREEMAAIMTRAVVQSEGEEGITSNNNDLQAIILSIKDYDNITQAYKIDVMQAYGLGIITGNPNGTFKPKNTATRAEGATVILRLIDKTIRKPFELPEPQFDLHKVSENGSVIFNKQGILKKLKQYPIIENSISNDFDENNKRFTDQPIEIDWYTQLAEETEGFLEDFFNRDYTVLDKDKELDKLLYWFQSWWYYREQRFAPKDFVKLWLDETEKWNIQQKFMFVSDSYRMVYSTDRPMAVRGRIYFKYDNHDYVENVLDEINLTIPNLQLRKWYYADVDVLMFNPASNAPVDWETSKWTLYTYHYLSEANLVEGQ